jgi:outer membrane protein TolC
MRDAEEALLNLINAPSMDIRVGPVAFDDYRDGQPNYAQSYKIAREFYPQRLNQEEQIKLAEMTLYFARKDLQPDVQLTGSLGYQARTVNTGFIDVLENLPKDHGNSWSLGVRYTVPLFQRVDKANFRIATNAVTSSKIQLDQIEANLQLSVRRAVRAIESNLLLVENAAKTTEQSVRQYELQKARFEAGLATAYLVLQTQEQLERNRINELSAKLALRRAVSTLRQLEGTSLERFRVQLPE